MKKITQFFLEGESSTLRSIMKGKGVAERAGDQNQYISEGMETIGNVAVSNSEEEKKCLPVFDDYVIDTAEDSKIYLEYRKRNMPEKFEEKKEKEAKEREESEGFIREKRKN